MHRFVGQQLKRFSRSCSSVSYRRNESVASGETQKVQSSLSTFATWNDNVIIPWTSALLFCTLGVVSMTSSNLFIDSPLVHCESSPIIADHEFPCKALESDKELEASTWDFEWDALWRPKECHPYTTNRAKAIKEVFFIRHGQYANTDKEEDELHFLTELGRQQAILTGARLRELVQGRQVRRIIHSDMVRARETAQLIAQSFPGVELIEDPSVAEGVPCLPVPASMSWTPSQDDINEGVPRIRSAFEKYFFRPPAPVLNDVNVINEEIDPVAHNPLLVGVNNPNPNAVVPTEVHREGIDIIVCHGNVCRSFFCRLMQFPVNAWLRFAIYNCGISWATIDDNGKVSCREFASVGHIPAAMISYS